MSRRVFITGYGVISAIGNNGPENFASLRDRQCGYRKLEILETRHRDAIFCCEIRLSYDELCQLAAVPHHVGYTRTTLLGLIAVKEAIAVAGLSPEEVSNAGMISATTAGGIRELEKYFQKVADPDLDSDCLAFLDTVSPGEHTERLVEYLQMKNYFATISTACSSATNAIILGTRLIRNGMADRMICGGAEALSRITINGFNSLMILDKEHCKPFDQNRNGLNLGEGAAYVILEAEETLQRSGKKAIAELRGYANVNDAFHQTASSPDGSGALLAMQKTLQRAGLDMTEIDYINAHGTATENNDLSEGLAIQALFGSRTPPFSSTKPYTGHTTSASGSIEAAFCLMAFQHDVIYPNINFRVPMEELRIRPITELKQDAGLKNILSNSLGFGGSSTSLLFSKC